MVFLLNFFQRTSSLAAAAAAAVETYHRIPRFGRVEAALFRRLSANTTTTTTTTTGSPGTTSPPPNVVTAVLLATGSDAAIGADSFAHAGIPDRTGPARGANGSPNITTTESPMEDDQPKLILYIVLPVCLAVIAFVLVAVAVRCMRRRKAANQARNETPDLWIRHSQELPLYSVDTTLPHTQQELSISPKTDLSTICEVLQTYVPQSPRELQLVKGEFLKIVEKDPKGWCRGVIGSHIGWFPGSFVKEIRTASLIEASDDEMDEEETTPPERLKPRVSSFMIKKRVLKPEENGQIPNDEESKILSRSHSEFGDIISLPRSRASTAGSSIYDDPDYVRFQQRSPACRLSIPDRFRNGSIDFRLGHPLLNNTSDNPYPIQRRMGPRRSEPISLLLQVPPSVRTNPPRPTRPAPPPPPSRKSAVITSTVAPSIATSSPVETTAGENVATSSTPVTTSEAGITSTTTAAATIPTSVTQNSQAPAQLQVSDPVPASISISAPIPIQIPVTTQNLIPVKTLEPEETQAEEQILEPTPVQEQNPVSSSAQDQITPPGSMQTPSSSQSSVAVSNPLQDQTLDTVSNETPVSVENLTPAQSPVLPQAPAELQPVPQAQVLLKHPQHLVPDSERRAEQSAAESSDVKQKTPPPTQPKPTIPPAVQPKPVLKPQSLSQTQLQPQLVNQPDPELQHTQEVQE